MNRSAMRRLRVPDAEQILADLTTRQFVRPHEPVELVVEAAAERLGFCRTAASRALGWLEIDATRSIGRLTRTQLAQLSRCVYRFCRQSLPREVAAPVGA